MIVSPGSDSGSILAEARHEYIDQQQIKAIANGKLAPVPVRLPPDYELIASNPQIGEELAALNAQSTPMVNGSSSASSGAQATSGEGRGSIVNVLG